MSVSREVEYEMVKRFGIVCMDAQVGGSPGSARFDTVPCDATCSITYSEVVDEHCGVY
jgi:hypothetical protein